MWKLLRQVIADATQSLRDKAERFTKQGMLERGAAVAAIMAYMPDKKAGETEIRVALNKIFELTGGAFDRRTMKAAVDRLVAELQNDGDNALQRMFTLLGGTLDEEDRRLLVQTAIVVGKSEGDAGQDPFSPMERQYAARICMVLKLSPAEFGLPTEITV